MMVPALMFPNETERALSLTKEPPVDALVATFPDRAVSEPTEDCVQLPPDRKSRVSGRRHTPVKGTIQVLQVTLLNSHTSEAPGQWLVSSQNGSSAHKKRLLPKCAPTRIVPRGQACIPLREVLPSTMTCPREVV